MIYSNPLYYEVGGIPQKIRLEHDGGSPSLLEQREFSPWALERIPFKAKILGTPWDIPPLKDISTGFGERG